MKSTASKPGLSDFYSIPYIGDNIRDLLRYPTTDRAPGYVKKKKILGMALIIWFGALLIVAVAPLTWVNGDLTDIGKQPSKDFMLRMSIYEIFSFSFRFLLPLTLMISAHARMY
jgi:hypothetical protein